MSRDFLRKVGIGTAGIFLLGVYIFLLAPLIIIIVGSFNSAATFPSVFESFTLRWYREVLAQEDFVNGIWVSAQVAFYASLLALILSIPFALVVSRKTFRGKDLLMSFFMAPLALPQIIMGLAMLRFVSIIGLPASVTGLVLIHAVFMVPFVLRSLLSSLARFDRSLEEAAKNLGANYFITLWRVILPMIRPGVTSGFLFAFIMSFGNVPLSLFLTSAPVVTLPIVMVNYLEHQFDPVVTAVGGLLVMGILVVTVLVDKVFRVRLLD
jgi:putative spermidine/putrescine transport system permease protein